MNSRTTTITVCSYTATASRRQQTFITTLKQDAPTSSGPCDRYLRVSRWLLATVGRHWFCGGESEHNSWRVSGKVGQGLRRQTAVGSPCVATNRDDAYYTADTVLWRRRANGCCTGTRRANLGGAGRQWRRYETNNNINNVKTEKCAGACVRVIWYYNHETASRRAAARRWLEWTRCCVVAVVVAVVEARRVFGSRSTAGWRRRGNTVMGDEGRRGRAQVSL